LRLEGYIFVFPSPFALLICRNYCLF